MATPRWEHTTVRMIASGFFAMRLDRDELEKKLVEMSEKGWDLISALPEYGFDGRMRGALLVFKRPYQDPISL